MSLANGTREIVVTSGYYSTGGQTTEIFNLDSQTWRAGPQLPTAEETYSGTTLPYGNSFLVVGGYSIVSGCRSEIWLFNPDSYEWEVIATMTQERYSLTAIAMPENTCYHM